MKRARLIGRRAARREVFYLLAGTGLILAALAIGWVGLALQCARPLACLAL